MPLKQSVSVNLQSECHQRIRSTQIHDSVADCGNRKLHPAAEQTATVIKFGERSRIVGVQFSVVPNVFVCPDNCIPSPIGRYRGRKPGEIKRLYSLSSRGRIQKRFVRIREVELEAFEGGINSTAIYRVIKIRG